MSGDSITPAAAVEVRHVHIHRHMNMRRNMNIEMHMITPAAEAVEDLSHHLAVT